mgnify:CR=1 FL=1
MIGLGHNHSTAMLPVAAEKARPSRAKVLPDPGGRPTVVTPEVVRKLEQAFSIDATITEACSYAGISRDTFYRWKDENPELYDKMESLRETPVLAMRQAAVQLGKATYTTSMDYLTRKRPDEFGNRSKVEHAGVVVTSPVPMTEAVRKVATEYEEKLRQAIVEGGQKKP